jgi:hypothetical protein
MTDRDHFAAAALMGMLSRGDITDIPARAWKAADAMLLERGTEIERLREAILGLARQDATLSVSGGQVTVTMDATLTDAEREAVAYFARFHGSPMEADAKHGKTLQAMLERLK